MKNWARVAALTAALAAVFALQGACRRRQASAPPLPPPPPKPKVLVVLLPEEGGKVGAIVVRNSGGSAELKQAYAALRMDEDPAVPPPAPVVMSKEDVDRTFGAVLAAIPLPERRFVLYFEEATVQLAPESAGQLPEIVHAIEERHSTDVSVTGHTDTTGSRESNYRLGLQRAERVSALLESRGVNRSIISVESHGEMDLLVKTPPNTREPRNRRVEVIVR